MALFKIWGNSSQNKQTSVGVVLEIGKTNSVVSHNLYDLPGRAVSCLKQNHLGRRASGDAQIREVFVLSQESEPMRFCVFPDYRIVCTAQSNGTDVGRLRK